MSVSRAIRAMAVLSFSVTAAACGGLVASEGGSGSDQTPAPTLPGHSTPPSSPPARDGGVPDTGVPGSGAPDVGPTLPPAPPLACSGVEPVSPQSFPSVADVHQRVSGVWILCSHEGEWWSAIGPAAQAGIVIDGNRWNVLQPQAGGGLVREQGFDNEGTVDLYDMSTPSDPGIYQLDFTLGAGGMLFSQTLFSSSGSTMAIDNEGATNTYVRSAEVPATLPIVPAGAHLGLGGCSEEEASLHLRFDSIDDARARLVGKWIDCNQTPSGQQSFVAPGTDGIELTADGNWYRITSTANGYQRGAGSTYELIDTSSSTTSDGNFQLNLAVPGGTQIIHWAVSDSPVKLRVESEGVMESTFSAL